MSGINVINPAHTQSGAMPPASRNRPDDADSSPLPAAQGDSVTLSGSAKAFGANESLKEGAQHVLTLLGADTSAEERAVYYYGDLEESQQQVLDYLKSFFSLGGEGEGGASWISEATQCMELDVAKVSSLLEPLPAADKMSAPIIYSRSTEEVTLADGTIDPRYRPGMTNMVTGEVLGWFPINSADNDGSSSASISVNASVTQTGIVKGA